MSQCLEERQIKAVRKRHQCVGCLRFIESGEPAKTWIGINDGEFNAVYYHPDCRAAEIALNDIKRGGWDDWSPLNEIDDEDRPWLIADHPSVAARFGWVEATS